MSKSTVTSENPITLYSYAKEQLGSLKLADELISSPAPRLVVEAHMAVQKFRLAIIEAYWAKDKKAICEALDGYCEAALDFRRAALVWWHDSLLPDPLKERDEELRAKIDALSQELSSNLTHMQSLMQVAPKPTLEDLRAIEGKRLEKMLEIASLACEIAEGLITSGSEPLSQNNTLH